MKTLEELRHRIAGVSDMQSVVGTMKTLAAARIRQFEKAAEATRAYAETIHLSLQILMRERHYSLMPPTTSGGEQTGLVLLGSDQGFCGRFNENVSQAVADFLAGPDATVRTTVALTFGTRLDQLIKTHGIEVTNTFRVPTSVSDLSSTVQQVIPRIEHWQRDLAIDRIILFYNRRTSAATYTVEQIQLIPLAVEYLESLGKEEWQSSSLPVHFVPWPEMFSTVSGQHLFLQLFRACAESLASENASRIAAMQQAENNIADRLIELNSEFNQNRQCAITAELLDIMSGFAATDE